jgi:hypothetical protein
MVLRKRRQATPAVADRPAADGPPNGSGVDQMLHEIDELAVRPGVVTGTAPSPGC